jgi:hypothetical protein
MSLSTVVSALLVGASVVALSLVGCGTAGSSGPSDAGVSRPGDGGTLPYDAGNTSVGADDAAPQTKLPPLPPLSNVVASQGDDSVSITFEPVTGALDYRVYPLPSDNDITIGADGGVVIKNAIYRCAGKREAAIPNVNGTKNFASGGDFVTTLVDNQTVGGYLRTLADATLGYVYTAPGPGLVPVYALGEADANADSDCAFSRWKESRTKLYTTSDSERAKSLAAFARDDGIAFYVPAAASSTTTQVYLDDQGAGTSSLSRYYVAGGPEGDAHPKKQAAFVVLKGATSGAVPLMRVFYQNNCGWSHDELVAGQERFNRAYEQGDQLPWWSLLWTGLTGPTTLVIEALDQGCPFQGHLSPQSIPSVTAYFGTQPLIHQPWVTIDDVRGASATTEVFLNGQSGPAWVWDGNAEDGGATQTAPTPAQLLANTGAGQPLPNAIARSFIHVAPNPHPAMDFLVTFPPGAAPETFTTVPCGVAGGNCFATVREQSPTFDQMFIDVESDPNGKPLVAYGPALGELWVSYADVGADTNGKYRLTANKKATIDASTFLHVTMEADAVSSARRYPQILISDQDIPVQYNLPQGHTLIIQPRGEVSEWFYWPVDYNLQICNLRTWDVNNQCPEYDLHHALTDAGTVDHLAPNDELGDHASVDHRVLFDVFTSTKRTYLFLDGQPYACADLPAVGVPNAGPVTVTWGDALYHSAVDVTFAFHAAHMQIEQRRHFDNLGFSSGVPAPAWDESRLPCAGPISP